MEKICPNILLSVPDTIDFDFITIKTQTTKSFFLNNTSDLNILFNIENAESFIFVPSGGILQRKKKLEIKIKINANLARVIVSNARIVLENKYHKILSLSVSNPQTWKENITKEEYHKIKVFNRLENIALSSLNNSALVKFKE